MAGERPSRLLRAADTILRGLLALAFLAAGSMKLAGVEQFIAMFDRIGIGQWFRLLTGTLEVGGALLVLVPRTSMRGAVLLCCVMAGAVFTHLAVIGGSPLPALILFGMAAAVLWLRRCEFSPQLEKDHDQGIDHAA